MVSVVEVVVVALVIGRCMCVVRWYATTAITTATTTTTTTPTIFVQNLGEGG